MMYAGATPRRSAANNGEAYRYPLTIRFVT